ncbi:MAG TPA: SMP-30/gluconolactonase/LRE family protein [Steroidobacteraceae bacterium]|nr:SMP-30/gluconolactonase/LRE family protein [Steroidobacteraceae bacterium]
MTRVASGLQFPEGPIAMADGSVVLVEIRRGTLTRVTPDGRRHTIASLGGGPNGAAIGPDGAVYVCNNGGAWEWERGETSLPAGPPAHYAGGSIQRVDLASGAFTTLYADCEGKPLNSPNDIVFDRTGGFWFTCLGYSDGENRRLGAIYYARPDGSRISRSRSALISPNGIGLSPDERKLYMADCMVGRLYEFDVPRPGELAPPTSIAAGRVVATLPGFQWLDSLAVEADGRICVATLWNGGITVFAPSGAFEHVAFPDPVTTNICFGGPDMRDAWVTCSSSGQLFKCRWPRPGLRLPFNA